MGFSVRAMEDPGRVLDEAGAFLADDPVRNNVILTVLHTRAHFPQSGRYWVVHKDGRTAGVVLQSPLRYIATLTPMPDDAVRAAVDVIVDEGASLPGVNGVAATAACFAGHWGERTRSGAQPVQGQRVYEVDSVTSFESASGEMHRAATGDRDLLIDWFQRFQVDIGEPAGGDVTAIVERRLRAGHLWLWDDGGPAALAGLSDPMAGVVRVGPVYTPPERRRCGYASSLVAATSNAACSHGYRCILYTDLGNPTSNSIYRALGYRAVAEALRYRFDQPAEPGTVLRR